MEEKLHFAELGYSIPAAEAGAWRNFDKADPQPGYFEFDWLSARHPDLYHSFALSTICLIDELSKLIDLAGLAIADVGAGTGRSCIELAKRARHVYGLDAYASVVDFGRRAVKAAGIDNVEYHRADRASLPLPSSSVDAVTAFWAAIDVNEAYRVLKPSGWLIQAGPAPGALCGELTQTLQISFPSLILGHSLREEAFSQECPPTDFVIAHPFGLEIPLGEGMQVHDFTGMSKYKSLKEAAAIVGRIYGPLAAEYMRSHHKSTLAWRFRIMYGKVVK
ncbi:MAG: class I SAM-dependent methyltransferase [Candidatus Dormibacteria bacterium]